MKFVVLAFAIMPLTTLAQNYSVALIPDSLIKDANVVERYYEYRIEIKDLDKVKTYEHRVYTILNDAGQDYAGYVSGYDKFTDIDYISGTLYDDNGKELKSVKKKDIEDVSGTNDENLIDDRRYKVHNFYYRSYPYTIDYEEEDNLNNTYDLDDWFPQRRNTFSIEDAKFIITTPKSIPIRYRQLNINGTPTIKEENGILTYTWEIKNVTAKVAEQLQPKWDKLAPLVKVAPTNFELSGYKGDMSTWQSFGAFGYTLLQGRDELPADIKQKVHELTDNLQNPQEKIAALYQYLQQNSRYISIQLGIGGLQPFDATYVATKKYGDCKALSNYMVALLKEAGIKAYSAWVRGDWQKPDFFVDFPSDQFNHVIACVPLGNDTTWLECTSQNDPPGYNGSWTGNRYALLLDENGGHLVPTTKYSADDNCTIRNIIGTIDETGKLSADINTTYNCQEQDVLSMFISELSKDKILEELKKDIDLPDYDVISFNYKENKSRKPSINEYLQLIANNYASVSGKRIFVIPNVLDRNDIKLKTDSVRIYNIDYDQSFKDIDTVDIQIPDGYNIESMPKDVAINNKFGNYEIHFKVDNNKIFCTRLYKRSEGMFPPSDYPDLVKFYDDMYKADRSRIVFVKKEG